MSAVSKLIMTVPRAALALLALLALAAMQARSQTQTQAQTQSAATPSAVEIYGVLDAGMVAQRGCNGPCSRDRLDSGVASGSRLGLRGREALGGGLNAVFNLEAGILNDTGASDQNGRLFGRQAFIGIDSPMGALTLGRQYNLVYETLTDVADPFHGGMAGNAANLVGYTVQRYDNTIKFVSPALHGLKASAIYSFGESASSSATNRAYGLTLGYAGGAMRLSLSHQRKNNPVDDAGNVPLDLSARNTLVAANVDVGPAVLYAAYGRNKGEGSSPWDSGNPYGELTLARPSADSSDKLIGLSLPSGPYTFLVSYIRKDDHSVLGRDANQVAIGATYAYSKRTDAYASYARINNRNGAPYTVGNASNPGHGDRALTIGLRHQF